MRASIEVACRETATGWDCRVEVAEGGAATTHAVTVSTADLARLAPGDATPDDLVRRSFVFLLAREPKESILRRFELPVIGRYFPEYEATITRRG
jgi:hypothetical protein